MNIILNGRNLDVSQIVAICTDEKNKVVLDDKALLAVRRSAKFLKNNLQGKIVYGINTGFGPMASHILAADQLLFLQENLIRSHATGMGEPIDSKFVLAAMVERLNILARGFSGVSEELLRQLEFFINHRIIPVVYEHGAVGTSGDLVQLAHIALALIGEGEVLYRGQVMPTAIVLKKLHRLPHKVGPKEGLSLINGTSMMTGIASHVVFESSRLLDLAVINGSLALELVEAYDDGIAAKPHSLRPHQGQVAIAAQMRKILERSKLLKSRLNLKNNFKIPDKVTTINHQVQEIYSLRCIPQILGPIYDTLQTSSRVVGTELNSVTDNPIVDSREEIFWHGGNFHGDYISSAIDQLKISLVKLTMLSERRTNFFVHSKINHIFPPFINLKKPGLTLALQGLQFVATSTTAQSQTLAFPHHIHSIPTNGDNQDIVSMGTDAALFANKVVENAYIVQAIELITLSQAVDYLKVRKKLSVTTGRIYDSVRKIFPAIIQDRVMNLELAQVVNLLKNTKAINLDW